ncbi:sarcosine oxidase subunit delta [Halochromatium roseum]|uniref:sarcosine oxidase subunit delta n=1 Tax=Halochromatium roseum TaxID=391920 RepID=UPI0019126722|nr:sarcosine oxidase subunit delta [Halochromatium roseum]MBK5937749.1 sarcosine oxidase subunit delta [Halochromatium roseum]
MKLIPLPDLGPHPVTEFDYGGEQSRPPLVADDATWAAHVFNRTGAPGVLREWWYHRPTGGWYLFERDTAQDRFLRSIPVQDICYELPTDTSAV